MIISQNKIKQNKIKELFKWERRQLDQIKNVQVRKKEHRTIISFCQEHGIGRKDKR